MAESTDCYSVSLRGIGKPRMTQRDKWLKRPCTVAYWSWVGRLRESVGKEGGVCEAEDVVKLKVVATYAVPKSWSKKKKAVMIGELMRHKPDADNVLKAVCDVLWKNDQKLAHMEVSQYWGYSDFMEIFVTKHCK